MFIQQLIVLLKKIKYKLHENRIAVLWFIRHYQPFKRLLMAEYKLKNIKPFKFSTWHYGCNYFLAETQSNKKVFIKTGGMFHLSHRESEVLKELTADPYYSGFFPGLICSKNSEPNSFIAIEFVEGTCLTEVIENNSLNKAEKKEVLKQFLEIVDYLQQKQIIHRDIRPDNIFIKNQSQGLRVVLIDFGFAVSPVMNEWDAMNPSEEFHKVLGVLGDGLNPKPFMWDDAYSFCETAKLLDPEVKSSFSIEWNELNKKIGQLPHAFY